MFQQTLKLTAIPILAATLAFAQTSGADRKANFVQHRIERLTERLSLTSDQQQKATSIFTAAANDQAALRPSFKTAREAMQAAVKANDAAAIDQASATLGNLGGQSRAIAAKAQAAFLQILTPDQQAKLKDLNAGRGGRFGRRGFGRRPA